MIGPKAIFRSVAIGIGLFGLCTFPPLTRGGAGAKAAPAEAGASTTKADVVSIRRIGTESCMARGCHGAVGASDPATGNPYFKGGEATTWRSFDPHSRAYDVLLNPRSVAIGKRLATEMKGEPPERAQLCLDCHSIGGKPSASIEATREFAAGVDCETCHGPASAWVGPHLSKDWPARSDQATLGFRPILGLSDRAKLCVGCHVGDSTRQVNHDLLAAGHPRLIFELDAFLTALPRHWQEPHEKPGANGGAGDFHAKVWEVGQIETTVAALDLLKSRVAAAARGDAPWPEFSEYDCFACHHELAKPSWRQADAPQRPPGALSWGSWNLATKHNLGMSGSDDPFLLPLRKEMARPMPDLTRVSKLAEEGSRTIKSWKAHPMDAPMIVTHLRIIDRESKSDNWDEAAARLLAAMSFSKAFMDLTSRPIDPAISKEIEALRRSLDFPEAFDSPKGFHP